MRWYWWLITAYPPVAVLAAAFLSINRGEDARRSRELERHHLEQWEFELEEWSK